MTVAELIEKLEEITDKSKTVWIYSYDDWTCPDTVTECELSVEII